MLTSELIAIRLQAQRSAAEVDGRELHWTAQLTAAMTAVDDLKAALTAQHEAVLQREQAMHSAWQQSRNEEQQLAATTLALLRDAVTQSIAAVRDDLRIQLNVEEEARAAAIAALTSRLAEVEAKSDASAASVKTELGSVAGQLAALDEEVGSIRGVLDTYNDDISTLNERGDGVEQRLQACKLDCERALTSTGDLSGRYKRLESDSVEARREATARQAQLKELTQQLPALLQQLTALQAEQGATAQQLARLQHEHDAASRLLLQRLDALEEDGAQPCPPGTRPKVEEEQKREEPPADEDAAESTVLPVLSSTASPASPSSPLRQPSSPPLHSPSAGGDVSPISASSLSRSHSDASASTSADLTSVFPSSHPTSAASAQRLAGVFTSPAKVNAANAATAWTINVKADAAARPSASRPPPTPPSHHTPRSASVSAGSPGKGMGGGAIGVGTGSERGSPASSRAASISAVPAAAGKAVGPQGSRRASGGAGRVGGEEGGPLSPVTGVGATPAVVRLLQGILDGEARKEAVVAEVAGGEGEMEEEETY